jgi:hypothetical protein
VDRGRRSRRPGPDDERVEPLHAAECRERQAAVEAGRRVSCTVVSVSTNPSER